MDNEQDFDNLKEAAIAILEGRRREHLSKARRGKVHAVYINLTPGKEDAPAPELVTEKTIADSNIAEAIFHDAEATRFYNAISEIQNTTYEESN